MVKKKKKTKTSEPQTSSELDLPPAPIGQVASPGFHLCLPALGHSLGSY